MPPPLTVVHRKHLPEVRVRGKRLGRHLVHDPRSLDFEAERAPAIKTTRHERHVPIFDQGELGSCTGNAAVGCLSTGPYTHHGTEALAVQCYSQATHLDSISGSYPPDDTGSSGLAVMRALRSWGWIKRFGHAFGLEHTLAALTLRPGILGITWLTGCDEPDDAGVIQYAGDVRGGHEVALVGLDVDAQLVWLANSWGPDWGLDGFFAMSFDDLRAALADGGDATFPALP